MTQPIKHSADLKKCAFFLVVFEACIFILYGFFVEIDHDVSLTYLSSYYPWLQDITVMMLIGFGYLMAIIKTNGWSAIGLTFLINALVVQIYILTRGFWEKIYTDGFTDHTIKISVYTLMQSEFAVASCLIAFGGVIGRVGPFQIFIMFLIQVFGYSLNEEIIYSNPFNAIDYGGSLSIHVFGAIYGLVVSYIIGKKKNIQQKKPTTDYISVIFSFFGSLFLWLFWPSFNSGSIDPQYSYMRLNAIINTLLSLTGSCLITFVASIYLRGNISADDILNATLSGGVIVGSSCNIITNPAGALAVGMIGGFLSTYGFYKLIHVFNKIGIYDSVGIAHLHGIPGILAGIASAIFISVYNVTEPNVGTASNDFVGINYLHQGGYQILSTLVTIGLAACTGIVSGLILNLIYEVENNEFFEDSNYWATGDGYLGQKADNIGNSYFLFEEDLKKINIKGRVKS